MVNDDTPNAPTLVVSTISQTQLATLIIDETAGVQNTQADADAPADLQTEQDVAALPSIFANRIVLANAGAGIAFAERDNAVTVTPHFGADGAGSTALHLTNSSGGVFTGQATNLFDTATNNRIYLYTDADTGIVVGRIGTDHTAIHPDAAGDIAFAIAIADDGTLSLVQYRALVNPDRRPRRRGDSLSPARTSNILYGPARRIPAMFR